MMAVRVEAPPNAAAAERFFGVDAQTLRLWAPWLVLAAAAVVALVLMALALAGCVAAYRLLGERETAYAALQVDARSLAEAAPSRGALAARRRSLESMAAGLSTDPALLLEHVEAVAAASSVNLLQFLPEATAATAAARQPEPSQGVSLQLRGGAEGLGALLHQLGGRAFAVELVSLRLSGGAGPGALLCQVKLRLHGHDALLRARASAPGRAPAALAADAPVWATLSSGVFGPDGSALAGGGAGVMRRRETPPGPAAGSRSAGPSGADPLAGIHLTGILRLGERAGALLELPAVGALLLHQSEALPGTRLRLHAIGADRVTLAGPRGEPVVLELLTNEGSVRR